MNNLLYFYFLEYRWILCIVLFVLLLSSLVIVIKHRSKVTKSVFLIFFGFFVVCGLVSVSQDVCKSYVTLTGTVYSIEGYDYEYYEDGYDSPCLDFVELRFDHSKLLWNSKSNKFVLLDSIYVGLDAITHRISVGDHVTLLYGESYTFLGLFEPYGVISPGDMGRGGQGEQRTPTEAEMRRRDALESLVEKSTSQLGIGHVSDFIIW